MFYCNLFERSNQKLYWYLGSLNKIDSIDIDYQIMKCTTLIVLMTIICMVLQWLTMKKVVPNLNDHQTMMPLGKYSYTVMFLLIF